MSSFKINKIKKELNKIIIFSFFSILFFLLLHSSICAQEESMPIDEIHSGMKGIGKTVFSGIDIEKFDVDVIDVISGTGINNSYVLVKLSGDKIDENGGISAGMSGSPVYIEEKLVGAISHAWEMSEHNLCLVTPIDRMIKLFDYTTENNQKIISDFINKDTVSVSLDNGLQKKLVRNIPEYENVIHFSEQLEKNISSLDFRTIQSPLLISGLDGRAHKLIESSLLKKGATSVKNISELQNINTELGIEAKVSELEPGSAVGVQLSTGDASVLTIGTATYRNDNYILAFGHPFMHLGKVSYLFSAVYIYHSFPSIVMPFKVGFPYRLVGEVIQDRDAGILANLNRFPKIVSCKVAVYDIDKSVDIYSGSKIVPQNDIIQSVTSALLIQSIDQAIDRIGQGTATVRLELRAEKSGDMLLYENMFFSKEDIAIQCTKDFEEIIDLMINNYGEKISLSEIKVDISIREQNQSAIIKEVKLSEEEYLPGDTIDVEVKIKPFRKPEEIKISRIELPDDLEPGEVVLIVRGGSSTEIISDQAILEDKDKYLLDGWEEIKTHFKKKVKNNQIVAELIPINERERLSLINQEENLKIDENELRTIMETDLIVEGYQEMYLNIKNEENKSKDRNHE